MSAPIETKAPRILLLTTTGGAFLGETLKLSRFRGRIHAVSSGRLPALAMAQARGVATHIIPEADNASFSEALLTFAGEHGIGHIVTALFRRLLRSALIDAYWGRVFNIHSSNLPAFEGLNPIDQSLAADTRLLGSTVHLIDESVGGGAIVLQSVLTLGLGLTRDRLRQRRRVHPCTNMECAHPTGMHAYIEIDYTEVVRPEAPNEVVPMGRRDAVVNTESWLESQHMIRYFPGDETELTDAPCGCGRTYPRLPRGIIRRLNDLLTNRGTQVYPSAVEAVLHGVPGVGTEFRILVDWPGALDDASVQLEAEGMPASVRESAEALLKASLGIREPVELVATGTSERVPLKARRVIDRSTP